MPDKRAIPFLPGNLKFKLPYNVNHLLSMLLDLYLCAQYL